MCSVEEYQYARKRKPLLGCTRYVIIDNFAKYEVKQASYKHTLVHEALFGGGGDGNNISKEARGCLDNAPVYFTPFIQGTNDFLSQSGFGRDLELLK